MPPLSHGPQRSGERHQRNESRWLGDASPLNVQTWSALTHCRPESVALHSSLVPVAPNPRRSICSTADLQHGTSNSTSGGFDDREFAACRSMVPGCSPHTTLFTPVVPGELALDLTSACNETLQDVSQRLDSTRNRSEVSRRSLFRSSTKWRTLDCRFWQLHCGYLRGQFPSMQGRNISADLP